MLNDYQEDDKEQKENLGLGDRFILDESLESVLEKLPLAQEIKDTLLERKGVMGALLKLVSFNEHAQWDKTGIVMEKLGLDKDRVVKDYNEALAWADEQSQLAS